MTHTSIHRPHSSTPRRALRLARISNATRYVWNWTAGKHEDVWNDDRGSKTSFASFRPGTKFAFPRRNAKHAWLRNRPYAKTRSIKEPSIPPGGPKQGPACPSHALPVKYHEDFKHLKLASMRQVQSLPTPQKTLGAPPVHALEEPQP